MATCFLLSLGIERPTTISCARKSASQQPRDNHWRSHPAPVPTRLLLTPISSAVRHLSITGATSASMGMRKREDGESCLGLTRRKYEGI
jgi:hypothetical protein